MTGNTLASPLHRHGFTLLEMLVNLGILSFLLLTVAATATWTSDTVSKTTGRLAAMEKSATLRQTLAADLARILPDSPAPLTCQASEQSWSLELTLPHRSGGFENVRYAWTRDKQTVTRESDLNPKAGPEIIATGITRLAGDWLEDLSAIDSPDHSQQPSWEKPLPPKYLHLHLKTTRAPTHSSDTTPSPAKIPTSNSTALIPITSAL